MNGVRFASSAWAWAWASGLAFTSLACAPPSPPLAPGAPAQVAGAGKADAVPRASGSCDAAPAQGAVGQPGSPQLAETARQQAGARTVRVIGHDDMVTKEYDTTRLNLQLDPRGRVVRVYCG